jgi:hypothetical protein
MSITTTSKATTQAGTLAQLQALILGLQKQLPSAQFTLHARRSRWRWRHGIRRKRRWDQSFWP